jgi:large subunit ribosomal protein L28
VVILLGSHNGGHQFSIWAVNLLSLRIFGEILTPYSLLPRTKIVQKGSRKMAICQNCGKKTTFGRNRPWSKKSTRRTFRPNLQKITVYEEGQKTRKVLCTKCIRTLVKIN